MGELVLDRLETGLAAFEDANEEAAARLLRTDDEVNSGNLERESRSIDLIVLERPLARGLRLVATSFKNHPTTHNSLSHGRFEPETGSR